jgi:N-acetylmuramoyl-L-alanine amidase
MFLDYYELNEHPFGACEVPQAFGSRAHTEALDSLQDALLRDRGNLALVAESGMGKSTLLRELVGELREVGRAAFLFESDCDSSQLLRCVLNELRVDAAELELSSMLRKLNEIWFAELLAGKRLILLLDDAENLDDDVLETLQQLSRFETSSSKLLQIVFAGQPAFLEKLERPNFAQSRKRIANTITLQPFSPLETSDYIRHRLISAGRGATSLFSPDALTVLAELSHGVPQSINKICSRALLEAYARGLQLITADIVEKAERNLNPAEATTETSATPQTTSQLNGTPIVPALLPPARSRFGLPNSTLWIGAAAGILLSAGLVLPHSTLKAMTHIIHGSASVSASSLPSEPAPQLPVQPQVRPLAGPEAKLAVAPTIAFTPVLPKPDAPQSLVAQRTVADGNLSLTRELGLKINRIVIDPGHGGFDTGAKGPHGLLEKDLCLDVALRLGRLIEENVPGAEVVYTRKDDTHVPLEERTAIANGADADLFISIHANSSAISEVRGVETYYLSLATSREAKEVAIRENALSQESLHDLPDLVKKITNNEKISESKLLALEIQDTLSQRLQVVSRHERNRGVKQAPFIVLTGANMPAVLSEISFLSNTSDESLLLEGSQRQRIADGLYRGISAYLDGLRGQPQARPKLVTENRASSLAFERAMAETGRKPL